jgi:hypothetical protein
MSITVMKLALDVLEEAHPKPYNESVISHVEAITALNAAIEAAEKQEGWVLREVLFDEGEPIAHREPAQQEPDCDRSACGDFSPGPCDNPSCPALRTTPPAAQPAPVQEPRHIVQSNGRHSPVLTHMMNSRNTPPAAQRKPLTDEEIDDIWNRYCDEMGEASINDAYDIARAIEAAHGITGEKT